VEAENGPQTSEWPEPQTKAAHPAQHTVDLLMADRNFGQTVRAFLGSVKAVEDELSHTAVAAAD
jgi:hypothetical protein